MMIETNYNLINGNAFEEIKKVEDNSIQCLVTSPPYNIGKSYEKKVDLERYLEPYEEFAKDLFQKMSDTGNICWQVGNFVNNGEVYPLDIFFYEVFKKTGFKLRNRIIWHFEHGLHASKRFSGRYETILWFSKTDGYVFNLDNVRVPSKYPGKRNFKGKNKGEFSGNPLGKNPSDFWKIIEKDWQNEIWDIVNVKSNHPEKTTHPCQFPVELVQRCVLALSNENDLVFDPFMGAGSTAIASLMHDRKFLGFELSQEYIQLTQNRITDLENGSLKIRPLTKQIYQPTGKEKISQVPSEWLQFN
jgi:adenine-specific DNA-methyltransferase